MAAASSSNLHAVTSPEHFQQLLSADLERVSVLYFYADWAEPCAAMTQAVAALADAHPAALFLQIEAEALPEVSESFEIDAVPYTILLRVRFRTRRMLKDMALIPFFCLTGPHPTQQSVRRASKAVV